MGNIFIYGLYTDEEDIRYIGKTVKQNIKLRLRQHILRSNSLKTHKDRWMQKSLKEGKEIKIKEIEIVNEKNWSDREKYWIKYYREIGNLTNHSDGGESGHGIIYTKSYLEVKKWVQKNLKIKSSNDWDRNVKSINLPHFIPSSPREVYLKRGWISWGDFLGTGNKYDNDVNYLLYKDAKKYIKNNLSHIKTIAQWKVGVKKTEIPDFIPNRPERYYNNKNRGWMGYGDFLGTGRIANQNKRFVCYDKCVDYIRDLKIKTKSEWALHCKSGLKPENIPSNPEKEYKNKEWVNWGCFVGNGKISDNKKHENYLKYHESMEYVKENYNFIKSSCQWKEYFKKEKNFIPENIPLNPQISYKENGWVGWGSFLMTHNIKNEDKVFPNYYDAKNIVSKYNIKSNKEWREFSKKECKRLKLPSAPDKVYKNNGWVNWSDWLGK